MRRRFGLRKTFVGLTAVAAIALAALAVAGSSLATPSGFEDKAYVSIAGTNLHASQIGSSSDTFTNECSQSEEDQLGEGEVLWHFVLVQTTALNAGELRAEFDSAGVTSPDVAYSKLSGGVVHWNVITPSSDTLLNASTNAVGAILNLSHVCGGGGSAGETSSISTTVHLGQTDTDPATVVDNANPAALGSYVHDSANLTFTGGGALPADSKVYFSFFKNNDCTAPPFATTSVDVSGATSPAGNLDPVLGQGPLGAGSYSYIAHFISGNSSVVGDSLGECEPFMVSKGNVTISTDIHNANHQIVTGVGAGSVVHDTATIAGANANFNPDMTKVSFKFFTTNDCTGTYTEPANTGTESTYVARSADSAALAVGYYSYQASFAGDGNYNPAGPATCEPLGVFQLGKTMGFWGNVNGIARIEGNGGYAGNAVNIGRGANIDTKAESLKVLPSTLNACGKGTPVIFTGQTNSADCSLASGVNKSSLNTLAAQTLALGYNIKLVSGYTGQSISLLGCTAYLTAGLTGSSTVNNAFTAAVALINGSASGGTTTQTQIGAMNALLGCLNREA